MPEYRSNVEPEEAELMFYAHWKAQGKTDEEIEQMSRDIKNEYARMPPQRKMTDEEIRLLAEKLDRE